jgi:hypothetical protein
MLLDIAVPVFLFVMLDPRPPPPSPMLSVFSARCVKAAKFEEDVDMFRKSINGLKDILR